MIKRIIFDIDNTLIPWKAEYNNEINGTLEELNIPYTEEEANKIATGFDEYEKKYLTFNKDIMVKFINEYTNKNYPKELVYKIIKRWEKCVPDNVETEILNMLEELKVKYELVILTDWYVDSQKARLEKAGLLPYFEEIYGAEKTKRKPDKEAFMQASGNHKPEECIMIGDNFERDIKGALDAGLKAIYYNPKYDGKGMQIGEYKIIKKLEEIKKIL